MAQKLNFGKKFDQIANAPVSVFGEITSATVDASKYSRLSHDKIIPFPDDLRPEGKKDIFDDYSEQDMQELTDSIRENGVLQPIILRESTRQPGKYEILAGHHRFEGNQLAGYDDIPYLLHNCDDNEAIIIFSHTNRNQRKRLKPSALAYSYKMELEAVESKAGHRDVADGKLDAVEEIAKNESKTSRTIYRYLQLTNLVPELLEKIDQDELSMKAGILLSSLPTDSQTNLVGIMEMNGIDTIKPTQADKLLEQEKAGELTLNDIESVIIPAPKTKPPAAAKPVRISLPYDLCKRLFPDKNPKEIEEAVLALLEEKKSTS